MKNYLQHGDTLDLVAPSGGVVSGRCVKVGVIIAIAAVTAAEGVTFAGKTTGCIEHAAATGQAWTVGQLLYWDDTAKVFTSTSSGNTKAGHAIAIKESAAAVGQVKLIPTI